MQTIFPFRPFSSAYTDTGNYNYSSHYDQYSYSYLNPHSWSTGGHRSHSNDTISSSHNSPPRIHMPFGPVLTDNNPSIPRVYGFSPSASTRSTPFETRQHNHRCSPSRNGERFLSDLASVAGNFCQPSCMHHQSYHARPRSARAYYGELPRIRRRGSETSEQKQLFSCNYAHSTPTQSRREKDQSVHWGQTQFLSEPIHCYGCKSSQEPVYHTFRDHHDTDGRYHMSGAIHPLDYDVFNILNPKLNLELHQNSGDQASRTSPEDMVNRPDYRIGDDSVDPFASVDPFRRERANGRFLNFRSPTTETQKDAKYEDFSRFCHLEDDIRQHSRGREHLENFCTGTSSPSSFHTYSYAYEPSQNPPDHPLAFSSVSSNFNPTIHRPLSVLTNHNFHDPFYFSNHSQDQSYTSPRQTSNHHHGETRNLFAELGSLHAPLFRKRRVLRRLTVSLRHDIAKVSLERARLRNQRRRYRQWCEQARDAWLRYETWQQYVREKQRCGTRYWEGFEMGSWGDEWGPGFDEGGVKHANESIPRGEFEDRHDAPTPARLYTPRTSSPRSRPQSQPHSEPYQAFLDNTKSLINSYNRAWAALKPRDYSSSIPWPSDDLCAIAIDKPTTLSLLAEQIADDMAKLREWNVFCFFTRAYLFAPSWNTKPSSGLEFSISANGIVDREGQGWGISRSWYNSWTCGDLLGLKKQVKIEATRWHPDKLANREMDLEDRERAKSVFHGIGRVKSMVNKLEECAKNTREL